MWHLLGLGSSRWLLYSFVWHFGWNDSNCWQGICLVLCPLSCVLVFLTAWLTHDSSSSYVGSDIPQSNSQETKVGLIVKLFSVTSATLCWLQRISPDSMRKGTTQGMRSRRYGLLRLERKGVCEGSTSLKLATLPHIRPLCSGLWDEWVCSLECLAWPLFYSEIPLLITNSMLLSILLFIKSHYLAGSLSVGVPVKWSTAILWGAQLTSGKLKASFPYQIVKCVSLRALLSFILSLWPSLWYTFSRQFYPVCSPLQPVPSPARPKGRTNILFKPTFNL